MRIVYCFIGSLPDYIIDSVHQTRLFYQGEIDCITTDMNSSIAITLQTTYRVNLFSYIKDKEFYECVAENQNKLPIIHDLKGRENLFIYSYDRYFALYHYMKQTGYTDILFLELDILLYDDPMKWDMQLCSLKNPPMAYMYDHIKRCAGGICYVRNTDILFEFMQFCMYYIRNTDHNKAYMTEMQALYYFWMKNANKIQLLPIHWPEKDIPPETSANYERYEDTIFDAAALGIYLTGFDPYHTNGIVRTGLKSVLSIIDYTRYQYDWKEDHEGRMIPYIKKNNSWIRINNLHVHSKQLRPYLSKEIIHNQN